MPDITALGELLIDFTPYGAMQDGVEVFERNPGGAPANVLAAASKLGRSTAFIGMVGNDKFGLFLRSVLESNGINTCGLKQTDKAHTTLAFVHLDANGDRSFSFYRNPGADTMLGEEDVDYEIIRNSKIFHFGSVSMTDEPCRRATLSALRFAKENSIAVSYDPNLRPSLWKDIETAKSVIRQGLAFADIIKVSEEELAFITDTGNLEKGSGLLYESGISVVFVTLGDKGCYYRYKGGAGLIKGYKVNAIDTTGAGDAFFGAALSVISGLGLDPIHKMDKESFEEIVRFANAAGALAATRKGAIPAMPDRAAIQELMLGREAF